MFFRTTLLLITAPIAALADCQQKDHSKHRCTILDLDNCYGDNNSAGLVEEKQGHFTSKCSGCILQGDKNRELRCFCQTDNGAGVISMVDMNHLVGNSNGYLQCWGINGGHTC
ncbi:Uu.00g097160.m01.CDS01 [Anthostomella pinea]|uniref:Uu.00g097160.m01.CDS01 n=1 Tax=Anthostomella pinea TaxID=933095 RepID=A0AAI8YF11_9PEZI|nr:Uu.00g097160.m01.CDS01 [Anthostomella pinea]